MAPLDWQDYGWIKPGLDGPQFASLFGAGHQGTHGMALAERFMDDEAPDAAGRTDD